MRVDKQQLIFMVEGLMDPQTRPGTIKMAAPIIGEGVAGILTNCMDRGIDEARKEAASQLGALFRGQGNPTQDLKGTANRMVASAAKGFVLGLLDSFFPDKE